MKKLLLLITVTLSFLLLAACHKTEPANTIQVGAMSGPETQLMDTVAEVLKKNYGVNMKVVTFTSYTIPNEALNSGDLDANYFQHLPYLNAEIKDHHYAITPIGNGFIYPMGIFSKKITQLSQLKTHDKVGIPNDPSNEARALLLLQRAGLIQLRNGAGVTATVLDITNNPKQLQIIPLDAAQLPRTLDDLNIAVINNTYAVPAGYTTKNALFIEDRHSPYVNIIVVRTADKNRQDLQDLVKAMQSPEVVAKAHELFGDGVVQGW